MSIYSKKSTQETTDISDFLPIEFMIKCQYTGGACKLHVPGPQFSNGLADIVRRRFMVSQVI